MNKVKTISTVLTTLMLLTFIGYGFINNGININAKDGSILEMILGFYITICCIWGIFSFNEHIFITIYKLWKKTQRRQ